ncbi:hypothetical protein JCGZ_23373 [Jatropha curcas]|uniref:HMA domain-containing protein n=2 Tax=Jatropha curcas TaxID=180498 RepID=A0A067JU71_JATCU|nr:hypothetical protein JCGZ_23373 [Jatropha curcas]
MKMQTCVLKVNIQCHCDGCKKKIKKLLQKVDGVYNATVNAEQGKVTVAGNFDPAKLIKKLEKSGKHAQIMGGPKGFNNFQNLPNNQFKNMKVENGKGGGGGGKDNKSQKGGKGGQQQQQQQQMQQFKGPKDLKMAHKDQKSVKFNLQDDYIDASDVDDFDDDFDEFDDDFDDEDFDDEDDGEFSHGYAQGHGHGHHLPNKITPAMMGNVNRPHGPPHGMMINGPMKGGGAGGGGGGGGGNAKKGGGGDFEIPVVIKGKGGNNDSKKGNSGKNGGDGGKSGHNHGKGGNQKQESKEKHGGKSGGIAAFLGFGRKSKNGRESSSTTTTDKGSTGNGGSAGNNHKNGVKKGGGKNDGVHNPNKTKQVYHDIDINGAHGPKSMGQVGQVRPMGNYSGMANFPAVQGLPAGAPPAMNGGYYQGMGMGGGPNPYSNQQYMAMMMNQQRQNGNDMFQPMMYARPPYPAVNYMPPPPMPSHPMSDPYAHFFSDENANSCSIM